MFKKLSILTLVCACSMSAAPSKSGHAKAAELRKRTESVRLVAFKEREVTLIQEAHARAQKDGKEAPLVAQQVERFAQGNREVSRDERNALIQEALSVLGREGQREL